MAQALRTIATRDMGPEAPAQVLAELTDAGVLIKLFFLTSPSPGLIAATERELVQVIGFGPIFITTRLGYREIIRIKLIEMPSDDSALARCGWVSAKAKRSRSGMVIDESQRAAARQLLAYVATASGVILNG